MQMPEPHLQGGSFTRESGFQGSDYGYTAEQMKRYGRDLLEEAAITAWNHYMDACKKS